MEVHIQEGSNSSVDQPENFNDVGWASFPEINEKEPVRRKQNPEDRTNFLSKLTFWWFNWIIYTGYKRPLEDKDLWALRRSNQASYIVPKLRQKWADQQRKCRQLNAPKESYEYEDDYKETDQLLDDEARTEESEGNSSRTQKKQKKEKKPSLSKILWSLFGINFAIAVLCKLTNDMLLFVQPQLLKLLIGYTEDKDDMFGEWKKWKGYAYAGGMFVTAIIQSLALHQYSTK